MSDAELGVAMEPRLNILNRGRRSVALDLKRPEGIEAAMRLLEKADALIEGFRPGVMERMGLGPDQVLARNSKMVYGRMTGWGQEGPLALAAGHDTNYIALTGALHAIGRKGEPPVPPLNLIGDFGGGALYLAMGLLAGLLETHKSGRGQVIDAAMVDGAASLMTIFYALKAAGIWVDERESNVLDGGAHFFGAYETKDGKYVCIASIEAKFYAELLQLCGLKDEKMPHQNDRSKWTEMKQRFAAMFKTKTRDQWCEILEGSDSCFAPVLSLGEAPNHPHMAHRKTFVEVAGVVQPGPAPRFSRTPSAIQRTAARPGEHTQEALRDWGFSADELAKLRFAKAIA
jgi:alpha-methylacyl-CoA racemase